MARPKRDKPAEPREIRVRKEQTSAELHRRLEDLLYKIGHKEHRKLTKPELVVELLDTHPKMKSL